MRRIALFVFGLFMSLVILMVPSMILGQGVYKWTDKDGNVHFSNVPTATDDQKPEKILPESPMSKTEECVYPKPISKTFDGATGMSSKSYDYAELEAYHECVKRSGKLEEPSNVKKEDSQRRKKIYNRRIYKKW